MKTLTDFINEARGYKPKFNPQDWASALEALNKGVHINHSKMGGMESILRDDYYSTAEEWVEKIYNKGFDSNHEFKDVITDIANFFINNWKYSGFNSNSRKEQDDILNCKSSMTDCDFGVEKKNWYTFYEYTGPSAMKKYAKEIAKIGNYSYMG